MSPAPSEVEKAARRWPGAPAGLLRSLVILRETVSETVRGFRADRGADLASSLAFATLLTAVPLLATFSLVLAGFFRENVTGILDAVNAILPYHTARVTENLREFVSESAAITGIGLAILVLASLRLISTIERIVNAVWGAPKRRHVMSRIALYVVVLFAFGLLFSGFTFGVRSMKQSGAGTILSTSAAAFFLPFAVEVSALTLLYRFLPNAKVDWASAGTAGVTCGLMLEGVRALFGLYVKALARINLITGSLTFILLTLISLFLVWVVILLGVELTHVLQTRAAQRRSAGGLRAGRAENAVRMLLRLAANSPAPFDALYREQEAPSEEALKLLNCLVETGIVRRQRADFALAKPAEDITVAQVVDAISPNLYTISPEEGDTVVVTLEPLFQRLEAERRNLLGATLAELKPES
ncbi:MAG TPA: YhjD/YihY/BrkB family envelope integrity protein [Thermoanaerobaculia bacterium]|nr:YhjD/YihY/BrkB family envelope integrity protein [Thermoanaerobaculia bacterium]